MTLTLPRVVTSMALAALAMLSGPASAFVPAKGDTAAYVDTRLQLTFDATPQLGTTGKIRVFKSDGTLVDTVDISGAVVTAGGETQTYMPARNTEIDKIGNYTGQTLWRFVYYTPVAISGTTATIKLHDGVLKPNTNYYVNIDNGVLSGSIGGTTFSVISGSSAWTFRTKDNPASPTSVTVDDDGPADFRSVQGALNWIMENGCTTCTHASAAKSILVKIGVHKELLYLRNVNNLTISGENRTNTWVQYTNSESYNPGTGGGRATPGTTLSTVVTGTRRMLGGGRGVFLIEGSDMLKLTNFTLRNTHLKRTGWNNQAETIYFNSSSLSGSRLVASSMNFISRQDTLLLKGWAWFYRSYVAGDVDFVWGSPFAAMFEETELRTIVDTSVANSGGYIFQSRAAYGYPGFVILNSRLTAEAGIPTGSTWLARSGGLTPPTYCTTKTVQGGGFGSANLGCDNIAFINTKMGTHVRAAGWLASPAPTPTTPTATTGWRERGSMDASGGTLNVSGRDTSVASTSIDLSGLDTRAKVFAQWNSGAGWIPQP